MGDEAYLSKQIEAQSGLRQSLLDRLDAAQEAYDVEKKKRMDAQAVAKLDAYNNWRSEQERKGKAYDAHCRNVVKRLMSALKAEKPDQVTECIGHVLGNMDGMFFILYVKKLVYNFFQFKQALWERFGGL